MDFNREMPRAFAKIPIVIKVIIGVMIIALIFYKVFYASYRENDNKDKFYINEIFSTVLSFNSFEGRSIEFHLKNGLKFFFMSPIENKLRIKDSIRKASNTYIVQKRCKWRI